MEVKGKILRKAPVGRSPIYPWEKWCNGQWWEVKPGEFNKTVSQVRQSIYQRAHRMGRKAQVTVTHNKTRLAFQFYDEEEA